MWNTVKQAHNFQTFLETLLVDSVRLIEEAEFPHSLVLHENDDNENVERVRQVNKSAQVFHTFSSFSTCYRFLALGEARCISRTQKSGQRKSEKVQKIFEEARSRCIHPNFQSLYFDNFLSKMLQHKCNTWRKIGFSLIRKKLFTMVFRVSQGTVIRVPNFQSYAKVSFRKTWRWNWHCWLCDWQLYCLTNWE